jgi:hypothetical protein
MSNKHEPYFIHSGITSVPQCNSNETNHYCSDFAEEMYEKINKLDDLILERELMRDYYNMLDEDRESIIKEKKKLKRVRDKLNSERKELAAKRIRFECEKSEFYCLNSRVEPVDADADLDSYLDDCAD